MKYGLVIFDGKIEDYFDMAAETGLSHLEMDLFAREQRFELLSLQRVKRIRAMARDAGITMSLHLPYCLNPAALVPEMSRACLDYFKKAFNLAAELGALWVTAHPGYYQGLASWGWMRREAMSGLAGFLGEILTVSEQTGIYIALENNTGSPENGQFFCLGNSVEDFQQLFQQLPSPYLRMCLDTGHAHTAGGVLPYLQALADRLLSVHVHDNNGIIDEHLPPGQGTIDWYAVLESLAGCGFTGMVNIELLNDTDKKDALRYLRNLRPKSHVERTMAL